MSSKFDFEGLLLIIAGSWSIYVSCINFDSTDNKILS